MVVYYARDGTHIWAFGLDITMRTKCGARQRDQDRFEFEVTTVCNIGRATEMVRVDS